MSTLLEADPDVTTDSPLAVWVRQKLDKAAKPLALKELFTGAPKSAKPKSWQTDAELFLEEEYLAGRVFRYPSGKDEVERFWRKDEKQAIRTAMLDATETVALPYTQLKKAGKAAVPGVQDTFVELVFRELIDTDDLYQHPGKTAKAVPNFGAFAPPPPLPILEQPANKKKLDTLATSAKKLLKDTKVSVEELLRMLADRLSQGKVSAAPMASPVSVTASPELAKLILKAVENAASGTVVILSELRAEMPSEFQGKVFDESVLKLKKDGKIHLFRDTDILQFSEEERTKLVYDEHGHHFTAITKRG